MKKTPVDIDIFVSQQLVKLTAAAYAETKGRRSPWKDQTRLKIRSSRLKSQTGKKISHLRIQFWT